MIQAEMDSFLHFCQKRQEAYNGKNKGEPWPWTDDELINTRRFTNVYRDLDYGSVWFFDRVTRRWPITELVMASATYRWVNWVPTFEEVGIAHSLEHDAIDEWCDRVDERGARGERVVTTRHNAFWKGTRERMHKLADQLSDQEFINGLLDTFDGVELTEYLLRVNGLGPFTAVQVAADLMTVRWHWETNGPLPLAIGSRFGLHILRTGEAPDKLVKSVLQRQKGLHEDEFRDLCELRAFCDGKMPHERDMNFIDLEHALCEWFRYRGTQIGAQTKLTTYETAR